MITAHQKKIRDDVVNTMAKVARDASAAGKDGYSAIEKAFPGTPTEVLVQAWLKADEAETEAWWAMVEQTIDLALVKQAVDLAGGELK